MIQKLKKTLLSLYYYLSNEDYRLIKKSSCFDPAFYQELYPDVIATNADPLMHYLTVGFLEPRQPNPFFDFVFYDKQVPELKKNNKNPLVHYLREGYQAGLEPNYLFDSPWYMEQNPTVDFSRIDPLSHFIKGGAEASTSLYFDPMFYRDYYEDVAAATDHPLVHYLMVGILERRRPSLYFDTDWYFDKIPILKTIVKPPLDIYLEYGVKDHKSPSPLFDPLYYASTCSIQEKGDLFAHYLKYGEAAGHRPCCWFDPHFYQHHYLLPENDTTPPLAHYLAKGVQAGLYPNRDVLDLQVKPKISLIVPVYNVDTAHLNTCIRSVLYQSYPHWEICLVDDCSTSEEVRPVLERWALRDSRIKVSFLKQNLGISGASNAAAALATGDYLGFLDNDDELAEECLLTLVQHINSTGADLYYSDEDLIGDDSLQLSAFRKPGYNPELLLGHNYITHLVVAEKSLFEKTGGFDAAMDGAQDFDLFLKLSELAKEIVHIPHILYHWRASQTSTSINHEQKQYANEAGRKALENALVRRCITADVEFLEWKFYYRVRREQLSCPRISVCILYIEGDQFLQNLSRLISSTDYPDVEFIIIYHTIQKRDSVEIFGSRFADNVKLLSLSGINTQAGLYNEAVRQSQGKYVIFLNSYVQFKKDNWIQALLEYGVNENVGIVGGRIFPGDDDEEFVATHPDITDTSDLYFARFLQESSRHMNGLQWAQNVFALSWNLALIEREYFLELEGFSEESFGNLFADSDLCFRIQEQGRDIIYTPFASGKFLKQEEQQTLYPQEIPHSEKKLFQKKWQKKLLQGDPFYNLNVLEQKDIQKKDFLGWYLGEEAG